MTGCGGHTGSAPSEYCSAVTELDHINIATGSTTTSMVRNSRKIAAIAPEDIAPEWTAYANAQEKLTVNDRMPTDFSDRSKAGESLRTGARIAEEAAAALAAAAAKIQAHVEDNCGK
ncbi:hypothetical protein [Nocardia brasiliensis]|uniref:hypothetical protein n=1 Tax=Nocardia brasiliensis TaxID=37326 RepID=UPI0024541B8B|nr:hypothetical protein [Nocardia brasiliensis]